MARHSARSFTFLFFLLAGCSGPSEPLDAGQDAGSLADAGSSDAGSGDAGSDAGPDEDAGAVDAGSDDAGMSSVQWITVLDPVEIDRDIALDYAYQYDLVIAGDPFAHTLTLERCIQIAGQPLSCTTEPRSNLPGMQFVRFGIDPSMYAVGENLYTFRLILQRDGELVNEDLLELHVTVTRCMMCVGS